MKKSFLIILFFLSFITKNFGQVAISYPTQAETVMASYGSSYLYVRLDFNQVTTTGADVTITLPTGFTYVASSLVQTGTNAGLTIAYNGGTANAPAFKIAPFSIGIGNWISFKIKRQATCTAISGTNFKDQISVTTSGGIVQDVDPSQNNYDLVYPAISFDQPAEQTNAVPGQTYTRTFTISNGGNGCTDKIYLSVFRPTNGTSLVSLVLAGNTLTPTSTVIGGGTTQNYSISGTLLTADQILCNGEILTFTETYIQNACSGTGTSYSTGWGPNAPPASWCGTATGVGTTTLAVGNPFFGGHTQTYLSTAPFVDLCTPFGLRETYSNTGTGVAIAAAMYDITLRKGQNYAPLALGGLPAGSLNLTNARINGNPVSSVLLGGILTINLNNIFNFDPDGIGVGLDDIDGDGFFDDLYPGKTITMDIDASFSNTITCATNSYGLTYLSGDMKYRTMCDNTIITPILIVPGPNQCFYRVTSAVALGYIPSNITPGTPFTTRANLAYYDIGSNFRNSNSRFVYEFTLPAGLSVAATPNLKWFTSQYPGNLSAGATFTVVGSLLTITSPNSTPGYPLIDLVYNCPVGVSGNVAVSIPVKVREINNIVTGCSMNSDLGCVTLSSTTYCPSSCAVGPVTTLMNVERDPNSYGWTDRTLTTRKIRSAISAFDLSKALYLDNINIQANATQVNATSNLYLRMQLLKDTSNTNGLTPTSLDVTIIRSGISIVSTNITTFTISTVTGFQAIDWNLTAILPSGGLLANDQIETISHYTVSSINFTRHDVQTGRNSYFYNLSGTTQDYCNYMTPEMYLVGTYYLNGNNTNYVDGCTSVFIGGGTNYIARRFDASGVKFQNEFRPAMYITSVDIKLPVSYTFLSASYNIYDNSSAPIPLTPSATITAGGFTTYTFTNPGTWPLYDITVENTYGATIPIKIQATCGSVTNEIQSTILHYKDYYYAYASPLINTYNVDTTRTQAIVYNLSPKISLLNITGPIQAIQPTENFIVRMNNIGASNAPYTWIAVPNSAGIVVTEVRDVIANVVITGINYSGGVLYNLSSTGLLQGTFKDYKISFTYTSCVANSFNIIGGWNCAGFPLTANSSSPLPYPCSLETITLNYTPVNSEIQVTEIPQLVSTAMCASQDHLFEISNSQASNVKDSTFTLTMPAGYLPVGASFQAQYPRNTGSWFTLTPTISGNSYTYNLTLHPNYPAQGIPGANYSITTDDRFILVKFKTNTDCDFVPGSKFQYSTAANGSCGMPATGSNINTYSN